MTQPRICPKSGMFIDEPEENSIYWSVSVASEFAEISENGLQQHRWATDALDRHFFYTGNCFATREDAQRYANYLKAMAKLRRLGGVIDTWIGDPYQRGGEYIMTRVNGCMYKLTPEEQNVLLWPDEVSPSTTVDGKPTRYAEHNEVEK